MTPSNAPGTHDYEISPDAHWAIHRFSAFDTVPTTELIRLPSHETIRVLSDNKKLKGKIDALKKRTIGILPCRYRRWRRSGWLVHLSARI